MSEERYYIKDVRGVAQMQHVIEKKLGPNAVGAPFEEDVLLGLWVAFANNRNGQLAMLRAIVGKAHIEGAATGYGEGFKNGHTNGTAAAASRITELQTQIANLNETVDVLLSTRSKPIVGVYLDAHGMPTAPSEPPVPTPPESWEPKPGIVPRYANAVTIRLGMVFQRTGSGSYSLVTNEFVPAHTTDTVTEVARLWSADGTLLFDRDFKWGYDTDKDEE